MTLGVFSGTIDGVWKDPSGYTRFSGVTASPAALGACQVLVLFANTPRQMQALLSPVSRIASQELSDFVAGRLSVAEIQARIKQRDGQMFAV